LIPELRTKRLILRDWRHEDLDAFAIFWMDPVASAYIGGPVSGRGEAWRKMASYIGHWQLRGYGFWVLQKHDDPSPLGYCGLWYPEDWPEPEIGWAVFPAYQRQGFASEAAVAVRVYAAALGWTTLISLINPNNIASQGVATKLGATREREIAINGKPALVFRHCLSDSTVSIPKE